MKAKLVTIMDAILYWSIVILPFSVGIGPALANILIGSMVVSFLLKKILIRKKIIIVTPLNLPFMFLFLASLLSFKNTIDFYASAHGIFKLAKYAFIFLICADQIRDKKHFMKIVFSCVAGAVLVSFDALWQIQFGKDFIRGNTLQDAIGLIRPIASFPNPNIMGVYLTSLTPLILGLAFFYFQARTKLIMLALGALSVLGVFLSLSRGAGLGLYLGLLFLGIVKKQKFLLTILIAVLVIFPFVMPKNIKDWAKEVNYRPLVFMCNYDRISIYKNTLNMIKHHPVVGVGVNTFCKNYSTYKLPESGKYVTSDSIYAHNNFLHMAGEIGLLGLLAFIWFLFALFRASFGAYLRLEDNFLKIFSLSLAACLIAFLINGLTETSLYYSRISMIFWYLVGLSLALGKFTRVSKT